MLLGWLGERVSKCLSLPQRRLGRVEPSEAGTSADAGGAGFREDPLAVDAHKYKRSRSKSLSRSISVVVLRNFSATGS